MRSMTIFRTDNQIATILQCFISKANIQTLKQLRICTQKEDIQKILSLKQTQLKFYCYSLCQQFNERLHQNI